MGNNLKRLSFIASFAAMAALALSPLTIAHASFDYTTGYIITLGGYFANEQLSGSQQWVGNYPVNSTLNAHINDSYQFGFLTNVLYQFTNTPYNVLVGYNHLNINENTQTAITTIDRASTTGTLDEIDLNLGRNFDLIQNLYLRLAAGARYTHIQYSTAFQSTMVPSGISTINGSANASYSGVGPIVFVDGNYMIAHGFSLAAHGYAGGILGNVNLSQADSVQTSNFFNYVAKNQSQLIPNFGGNLGIGYTYINYNYKLSAELGYMIDYYGSAIMLNNNTSENFTGIYYSGPYLNLRVGF